MPTFVVWIDHEHAKAFALTDGGIHKTSFEAHRHEHHTHRETSFDRERRSFKMFAEVVKALDGAERLLVVGPGLAKHLFTNCLAEHHPRLFRKVVGCETLDHPTDPQIRAFAEKFFMTRESVTG